MRTAQNAAAIVERPEDRALVAVLAKRRLKELDRLRDLGFKKIEQLNAAADSMPRAVVFDRMLGAKGQVMEFERLARAIRQIVVLEFEIRGLFQAPNRDARRLRLVKSDREGFEPPDREDLFADLREFERDLDDPRPDSPGRKAAPFHLFPPTLSSSLVTCIRQTDAGRWHTWIM